MSWTSSMSREQVPSLPISPHNHPLNPTRPTSEQRLQNNRTCTHWHVHTPSITETHAHTRSTQYNNDKLHDRESQDKTRLYTHHKVILNVLLLGLKLALVHGCITIRNSPAETKTHSVFILLTRIVKYWFHSHSLHASQWILQVKEILTVCLILLVAVD